MRRLGIAMLMAAGAMLWGNDAYAGGYGSIGSGWTVNTYTHSMTFLAPQADVKNDTVLFISRTAWVNNLAVCRNNGGKVTFIPGGGQSDPLGIINPAQLVTQVTPTECTKNGSQNVCNDSVTYISKVGEVVPSDHQPECNGLTQNQCFLVLLDLPLDFECQNNNGLLVQVITREVCAEVTASKNGVDQVSQFYRFTFPSFNQPELATFTSQVDPTCQNVLGP
jgi:hypothetical protein